MNLYYNPRTKLYGNDDEFCLNNYVYTMNKNNMMTNDE